MHHDVRDLRNFYYRTALGRAAQRAIRDRLVALWPPEQTTGMTVAGFGFAVPLLRPYLGTARRVIGLMPGPQGVMPWPAGLPNVATLCEETAWPLETGMVDRAVLLHGLETADQPAALLDELWRVLGPGGRAVVIVPNRAGLWSRSDATPFGQGRPYTAGQLESQLRGVDFVAEHMGAALYIPPSDRRFWLGNAALWERLGLRLGRLIVAGVIIAEVSKQVHAPLHPGLGARVRRPLSMLAPQPARPALNRAGAAEQARRAGRFPFCRPIPHSDGC
ncbi:methyltransferase domain-containing protein [Paracoccus sp. p3-h83]|uniref:methyltransferase domain-containing protein n=1 Tax=Paracoccus sp. p3-h83 TaxID=3342805 RepID=UPI0035B7A3C8